eukprot:16016-Heterococcus_DN1.PRE.1
MMLKQDQPLRVGIAAVGTFLVACFLTFAISPLLVRSKVRCNPLTHRYCAAFEIADTADAIGGHSSFSVVSFATLPAITASERSCMIRDAAHIATSASSQLVSLNLSRQLPAVAIALTASSTLSELFLSVTTAACATAGGQEQADQLMVCQESDGLHDRVPWHCDSDSCAAAVLQH